MSNLNPAAYPNGMNLTNGIVSVPNAPRGITPMHLMGQVPQAYNLGFPTMVPNMNNINSTRLPSQMQMALGQNPSPPMSRNLVSFYPRPAGVQGKFILRVFLLCEYLMCEKNADKKNISYWKRTITEFFADDGKMKYGLWNQSNGEIRIFDIPHPIIPRFFHVNFESGVTSIQLTMNNIKENFMMVQVQPHHNAVVEAKASMIYEYEDGSRVVATGKLKVRFNMSLKIESFEFMTDKHTEYVPRHYNLISNESPICEFGIPQKTLRSLEVAEGVVSLNDLINLSISSNKGPLDALSAMVNLDQQTIINQSNHNTPPTPGPSPPEQPAKTPKEKAEATASDNTQTSTSNDVSASPSTSNANLKTESPTTKPKSPLLQSNKRSMVSDPKAAKRARQKVPPRKNSRQDTG